MAESRGRFGPVVLGGLLAAGLAAVAGNQDWASVADGDRVDAAFASAAVSTVDASAPPVTALALVLLATWGVVLVSRGRWRRAVTFLGLVAAVAVLGFAVAAWIHTPGVLEDASTTGAAASRTVWSYLGVLAGVAAVATSAVATRAVRGWPEMGRRYDAPSDGAPRPDVPLEAQTNLELWKAIDEGRDPTDGATH